MVTPFSHLSVLALPIHQLKACRCDGSFIWQIFPVPLLGSGPAWLNEDVFRGKMSLEDWRVVFKALVLVFECMRKSLWENFVLLNTRAIAKWKRGEL